MKGKAHRKHSLHEKTALAHINSLPYMYNVGAHTLHHIQHSILIGLRHYPEQPFCSPLIKIPAWHLAYYHLYEGVFWCATFLLFNTINSVFPEFICHAERFRALRSNVDMIILFNKPYACMR